MAEQAGQTAVMTLDQQMMLMNTANQRRVQHRKYEMARKATLFSVIVGYLWLMFAKKPNRGGVSKLLVVGLVALLIWYEWLNNNYKAGREAGFIAGLSLGVGSPAGDMMLSPPPTD